MEQIFNYRTIDLSYWGVKMNGLEQDLMNNLQRFFKSRHVELAYLFGSRARGKVSFLSDYDFAILAPDGGFEEYYRFFHDLSTIMNSSWVDVVMLKDAPVELRYRAITGDSPAQFRVVEGLVSRVILVHDIYEGIYGDLLC